MNGLNNIDRAQLHRLDQAVFEKDMAATALEAVGENPSDKPKGKERSKQINETKPVALSILDDKTEVKDLFENFSKKAAKSSLLKDDLQTLRHTQSRLASELEQLYKHENMGLGKDEVILHTAQQAKGQEIHEKNRTVEDRLQDSFRPHKDDTPAEQLQKQAMAAQAEKAKQTQANTPTAREKPTQELAKNYVMAFAETLIRPDNAQKKHAARDVRERLLSAGYSPKQIQAVEQNVHQLVRQDLRKRVKEGFVQFALSYSKNISPELVKIHKQFEALEEMGFESGAMVKDGLPSNRDVKEEAKTELRAVVADELDRTLMETKMKGGDIRDLMRAFNKFNELASVVKFDANTYLKGFREKLEDLGLHEFESPNENRGTMDTDSGQGGQRQPNAISESELESLEDKLRILFMKKLMRTDLIGSIETRMHLVKAQNQLKKAGHFSETLIAKLQQEGEALAKTKFSALLTESLEEKASLSVLSGPAYDLVKRKFKTAMRGLKRLDAIPTKEDIVQTRDQINRHMFSVIKEEFLKIEALMGNTLADQKLTKHRDMLLAHLNRLKKESNILEELRPKILQNLQTDASIVEAA